MNKIILFLTIIFLINLTSASFPGNPHQFYGNVSVNGTLLNEGIVTAKINGNVIETGQISKGRYGYGRPLFFVEDPDYIFNGKTIIFYVNGFEVTQFIFENGESTRLDLNCVNCEIPMPESIHKKSFFQNSFDFCDPIWKCSAWSECDDGIKTRQCEDKNNCAIKYNQPLERSGCEIEKQKVLVEKQDSLFIPVALFIFLILILIILLMANRKS